ncbi:MAG: SIS domain-containing protein [Spirochaetales bacterium]|jgi:D-sedoheptulose 7-phosphate isomerase
MFAESFGAYQLELAKALAAIGPAEFEAVARALEEAIAQKKQVFVLGNGGSAAAATHWVCDFNKGTMIPGFPRARFVSLSDNLSTFTALANDLSYSDVFIEQLKNFLEPGDVVLGLSVSGNSENIVKALSYARQSGASAIAIVGDYGGRMLSIAQLSICIHSRNFGIVEDIHIILSHSISQHIRKNRECRNKMP